jgi:hypothetical protein
MSTTDLNIISERDNMSITENVISESIFYRTVHVAGSVITKIAMRFMKNDAEDY